MNENATFSARKSRGTITTHVFEGPWLQIAASVKVVRLLFKFDRSPVTQRPTQRPANMISNAFDMVYR
jgi:hypothetical protein